MNLPPTIDATTFKAGERFCLSKLGAERCPRLRNKVGVIVTVRESLASVVVLFDGNRNTTTIHRDYIEPIDLARP